MAGIDSLNYAHSPIHLAIATGDHNSLRKMLADLPSLSDPSEVRTEAASLAEEQKTDAISSVIDRRDVPNRESPLHLAVKMGDETATEMLMMAGADWSLQNEQGWSALQEAICNRQEGIAMIIVRHYQHLAWAKWCRRLPRLVATMKRMRDFYMEITFHFESSVIPFISRIAPSDTYKIWKRGASLRADMTLAGFDGFRIQRSDQSILFLGDGSEDGKVAPGSLCMISHKDKEITNALERAGAQASETEIRQEVAAMSQTNIFRPGIDVTKAVLLPQLTWRRQEKSETVGLWKAKVYEMHNVVVSIKSRRVPGAMTDEELFAPCSDENDTDNENDLNEILTEEEKKQLEAALKLDSSEGNEDGNDGLIAHRHSCYEGREIPIEQASGSTSTAPTIKHEKKGWFGGRKKRDLKHQTGQDKLLPPRSSLCLDDEKVGDLAGDSPPYSQNKPGRHSVEIPINNRRDVKSSSSASSSQGGNQLKDGNKDNEYKKGLRPVLWLSPDFPLRTAELLPLLDILANKVKAVRRLRDLLTTKLPAGTFPVKVAIPVVPTVKVLVTFTKFEELQPAEEEDEFRTPPSSPQGFDSHNGSSTTTKSSSSSWFRWIKSPYGNSNNNSSTSDGIGMEATDPFAIPTDYTWITPEAKKKKLQQKNKSKRVIKQENH